MKKKKALKTIGIIVGITALLFVGINILYAAYVGIPSKDKIDTANLPEEAFSTITDTRTFSQKYDDCGGYATAYVLRQLGYDVYGEEVFAEMNCKLFGGVTPMGIVYYLKGEGINARYVKGDMETIKAEIAKGNYVIVNGNSRAGDTSSTHYNVATGYDSKYMYMIDSVPAFCNAYEDNYNRRIEKDFFEKIMDVIYPFEKNSYIVIEP